MDLQFNFLAFEIRWRLQCWANHYYFLHTIFTTGWVLLSCQLKGPWSPPMMNGRFASVCYSWPVACHGQAVWGCISDQAIQPSLVSGWLYFGISLHFDTLKPEQNCCHFSVIFKFENDWKMVAILFSMNFLKQTFVYLDSDLNKVFSLMVQLILSLHWHS